MSSSSPTSWLDRLVGMALSVLVTALALYIAGKLIAAVAIVLLVTLGVGMVIGLAVVAVRSRHGGW